MSSDSAEGLISGPNEEACYDEIQTYAEFPILIRLVEEPEALVYEAVRQTCNLTSAAAALNDANALGLHAWHTCLALIEIAKRTAPAQQTKLVQYVVQLQKVGMTSPATGGPLMHDRQHVWEDLPTIGYTVADEWGSYVHSDFTTTSKRAQNYENLITFLAQVSAATDIDYNDAWGPASDFTVWSFVAFRAAFDPKVRAGWIPTVYALRTACMWSIYGADRLWANVKYGRVFDWRGDDPGIRMTREMWDSWERGFLDARITCTDERTKTMVDDALSQMRRAQETDPWS